MERPKPSSAQESSLIDPSDFESVRLEIAVANTTTRTEIRRSEGAQLIQALEQNVVLDLPPKSCNKGHHLTLTFLIHRPGQKKPDKFECTATVEGIEQLPEGRDQAHVALFQYDEREWAAFRELFSSRQDEILRFFSSARGY